MCSPSSTRVAAGAVLAVLLALLFTAAVIEADVVAGVDPLLPVCKTVGGGSTFFDVEFCLSALGSDDRSRDAERYRDLSAIAVDLVTANVTSTVEKISGLIRAASAGGEEDEEAATMTRCLRSCQALYGGVLRRKRGCAAAVRSGRFGDATAGLERSASAAKECEAGFAGSSVTSPLTVEDDSAFKLAMLAVALLRFAS